MQPTSNAAPFPPYVAEEAPAAPTAGVMRSLRLFAFLIDSLVVFVVGSIWSWAAVAVGIERTPYLFPLCTLPAYLVQWFLLTTRGQTLGKIALGLRVVRLDGTLPGLLHGVVLRAWPFLVVHFATVAIAPGQFLAIDALFIFGAGCRCLHDRLAGTRVVLSK